MKIRFFDAQLEESTIAKVLRTIDLLEMFGHKLTLPHSKKVHTRLFELRARGKQEVRILYTFYKDEIVLLHGFVKKSARMPNKEIVTAQQKLKILDVI